MIMRLLAVIVCLLCQPISAQQRQPIVDMHVHSYDKAHDSGHYGEIGPRGLTGSPDQRRHFEETLDQFKQHNVVKAVVSGPPQSIEAWLRWDEDDRIVPALYMESPTDYDLSPAKFEKMVKAGSIRVFGEIGAYYSGTTLSDSAWAPYLEICEQYDIPVAVHTGGGAPGGTYAWAPKARLSMGDPYLIEDVLVRHPNLRIYIMHAGEQWHERTLRLMEYYPQLYTDVAVLLWVTPTAQRYAREFLENAKHAGVLDRVMFGSDQMGWPQAIELSINYLESLEFLSDKDLENIYYNNAMKFLGPEE